MQSMDQGTHTGQETQFCHSSYNRLGLPQNALHCTSYYNAWVVYAHRYTIHVTTVVILYPFTKVHMGINV